MCLVIFRNLHSVQVTQEVAQPSVGVQRVVFSSTQQYDNENGTGSPCRCFAADYSPLVLWQAMEVDDDESFPTRLKPNRPRRAEHSDSSAATSAPSSPASGAAVSRDQSSHADQDTTMTQAATQTRLRPRAVEFLSPKSLCKGASFVSFRC